MATHTVNGCYIAATGQFEFDDTECPAATITGCRVESGEHAGEIEITHDYDGCETQYYACYDPATGKFEFEADDGCCVSCPEGSWCEENCEDSYQVTITGFTGDCSVLNGIYDYNRYDFFPCTWRFNRYSLYDTGTLKCNQLTGGWTISRSYGIPPDLFTYLANGLFEVAEGSCPSGKTVTLTGSQGCIGQTGTAVIA